MSDTTTLLLAFASALAQTAISLLLGFWICMLTRSPASCLHYPPECPLQNLFSLALLRSRSQLNPVWSNPLVLPFASTHKVFYTVHKALYKLPSGCLWSCQVLIVSYRHILSSVLWLSISLQFWNTSLTFIHLLLSVCLLRQIWCLPFYGRSPPLPKAEPIDLSSCHNATLCLFMRSHLLSQCNPALIYKITFIEMFYNTSYIIPLLNYELHEEN